MTVSILFQKNTATLYVPEKSVNAYKSTNQWKDFGTILPIVEPVSIQGDANGNGEVEIEWRTGNNR